MLKSLLLTAAAAATVLAAPAQLQARQEASSEHETNTTTAWDAGAVSMYPIHESCNTTQRKQIAAGLNETIMLADHAKQHILRWGNNSELYHKYFGELPPYEAIGAYDLIVSGDQGGVLFRCDDPDDNCHQDGKLRTSPPRNCVSMLTRRRMGRPLARRERNRRDRHLPALVREPKMVGLNVRPRLHRRR